MNRSRVKPISDKRRDRISARRITMEIVRERDHCCQGQRVWSHECRGNLVGHEPHKRSAGGDETDVDQVLLVCEFINAFVEDEPEWALSVGLSVHAWETWSWSQDWGAA